MEAFAKDREAASSSGSFSPNGQMANLRLANLPHGFAPVYLSQENVKVALGEKSDAALRARWLELTGIDPSQAAFTIIVPVHNEARLLPSTLRAINRSNIPPDVSLQVVFVCNGSTDSSPEIIRRFFGTCDPNEIADGSWATEPEVGKVQAVQSGNKHFVLVERRDASKAHAIQTGLKAALHVGHKIAICVDSDSFVEPDAIPLLYSSAVENSVGEPDSKCVVVSGNSNGQLSEESKTKRPLYSKFVSRYLGPRETTPGLIYGPLWACDAQWTLQQISKGSTVTEDLAISVRARVSGKSVITGKGRSWYYYCGSWGDYARSARRFALGHHQLLAELGDRRLHETMLRELKITPSLTEGLFSQMREILIPSLRRASPAKWPLILGSFAFHAWQWHRGAREYRQDPNSVTWERCESTK